MAMLTAGFAVASCTLFHFRVYTFGVHGSFLDKWEEKDILLLCKRLILLVSSRRMMIERAKFATLRGFRGVRKCHATKSHRAHNTKHMSSCDSFADSVRSGEGRDNTKSA